MSSRLQHVSSWGPEKQKQALCGHLPQFSIIYLLIIIYLYASINVLVIAEAKQKHLLMKSALHISVF